MARRHGVHANQIYKWKKEFMGRDASVFEQPGEPASGSEREKELLEKIDELTVARDFFSTRARATPLRQRRSMIQVQAQISLRRQCELLAVGRSGLYFEPVGTLRNWR